MTDQKGAPRVVVLGAGLGMKNAWPKFNELIRSKVNLTVIDAKPFFENTTAAVRSVVDAAFFEKTVKLHTQYLDKKTTVVIGSASELTTDKHVVVQTASGEQRVPYDYLVIATGTSYPGDVFKTHGLSLEQRRERIGASARAVAGAKHILVVGGGAVSCEVAGEITAAYPNKRVTLVQGPARLLPSAPLKSHTKIVAQLKARGVRVLCGHRIQRDEEGKAAEHKEHKEHKEEQKQAGGEDGDGAPTFHSGDEKDKSHDEKKADEALTLKTYRTDKGETIEADLVFWCTGVVPNSGFMRRNYSSLITEQGQIRVRNTFQVEGLDTVFAFGDVAATRDAWLAYNTIAQGEAVVKNLAALLTGKQPPAAYKLGTGFEPMIVMGPQLGVLTLPFKCCGCCDIVLVGPKYSQMKLPYMASTPPDAAGASA